MASAIAALAMFSLVVAAKAYTLRSAEDGFMNLLIYPVPMAVGLGLIALFALLWALKSGQYEDIEAAALRVSADDDVDDHAAEAGAFPP